MKKLLLTLLVAVMGLTASAQIYVGGEVGFWRNTDANKTNFKIIPEIGYVLSDKWAIGTTIGYDYTYNKGVKDNAVEVAPYARYTAVKFGAVSIFLDGGFGFSTHKYSGDGIDSDSYNAWYVGIRPGVDVKLSKNIDFVAHCGFLGYRDNDDNANSFGEQGFGFDLDGNNLTFGIYYTF